MKIVVDLEELIALGITMEQYYLLALLYFNKMDLLVRFAEGYGEISVWDIETLKEKELLTYTEFKGDVTSLKVTEKGREFVHLMEAENQDVRANINEQQFNELLATYPTKTPSSRRLQGSVNGATRSKFIKKYFQNLKLTNTTHAQVIEAIKREDAARRQSGSANFWAMLSTYINQAQWTGYLDKASQPVVAGGHLKAL